MIAVEISTQTNDLSAASIAPATSATNQTSADVLRHLALARSTLRRLKEVERGRLDPWEETSLAVAEQSLERAWLALSQLHADLQRPRRKA